MSFAQVKIENYQQTQSQLSFNILLKPIPFYYSKNKNGSEFVNFAGYTDESSPGKYSVPSREIFIALPTVSDVNVTINPIAQSRINGVPQINPNVYLKNDSTLNYEYNNAAVSLNYQQMPLFEIKGYLWIRNYYCVNLKINQYRYNGSDIIQELNKARIELTIKHAAPVKPSSFNGKNEFFDNSLSSLIINYNETKPRDKSYYKLAQKSFNDSWINFNDTYLKIGVAADGIYRISYADLLNIGIPVSQIDPKTFILFVKGKQQPIYVSGKNDGSFDSNDYIEFTGRRNWGDNYRETSAPGGSYKEYLNRYTDTTTYWLTWGDSIGERIDTTSVTSGVSADTLDYYSAVVHYEQNRYLDYSVSSLVARQDPDWLQNETWVWAQQGVGTADRTFTVHDVYPKKSAQAYYKIQDYASDIIKNAHKIGLSINSDPTVYDSVSFDKYAQKVVKANFSSNLLSEGNNILKTISFPTNASLNSIAYDWYEVEYPRFSKAINDSLRLKFNDITSPGLKTIKITNVNADNILIYKVTGVPKKITNYVKVATTVYFNDTVRTGDQYYLTSAAETITPVYYYIKKFNDLKDKTNQADYILLTCPEFLSKAKEYTDFIQNNYNVTTKIINVNDIYDQFNYGFFAPEPIKEFLEAANLYWKSPKPVYLFIVGDANYDYYGNDVKYFDTPPVKNYVPSYGDPVSDSWFTIWDTTGSLIQQMYVGRLPVSSNADFDGYFQKHKKYLTVPYDIFNKTYLLFSSGDASNPSELEQLKSTNDFVATNIIEPRPIGGIVRHLYKTADPLTNFGPYTEQQVHNYIRNGGILISYIGHSGTQIWDNGINAIQQLDNISGKSLLISDWGCSTGKFAEPDIKAFGELFVVDKDGQAICYTGNSSLGFTSLAALFPPLFYSDILQNGYTKIGQVHAIAKSEMLQQYGNSGVYRIFDLCNVLIGDPIIDLKIPPKPNLDISEKDIHVISNNVDDSKDSVELKIEYYNLGKVDSSSFTIRIKDILDNKEIFNRTFQKSLPLYADSLTFYLPVKNLPGDHNLQISLDDGNKINEISETDNNINFNLNIPSSSVRALVGTTNNLKSNGTFILLNPIKKPSSDSIIVEYADNSNFLNSKQLIKKIDTLSTTVNLLNLVIGKRYWLHSKLNSPDVKFGGTFSFIFDTTFTSKYSLSDSVSYFGLQTSGLDLNNSSAKLTQAKSEIVLQSAGFYDGTFAVVSIGGKDYVKSSNLRGHHILVFDEKTLKFEYERLLSYYDDQANFAKDYIALLDTIPDNKIIAIATCDDPAGGLTTELKNKLKSIGSTLIDSIKFRNSWGMITKKNYTPGHVLEGWTKSFNGPVTLDTIITSPNSTGSFTTSEIGPSSGWRNVTLLAKIPQNSFIRVTSYGIKNDGSSDSLFSNIVNNNLIDLSSISAKKYPYLKFNAAFVSSSADSLPVLSSFNVNYLGVPELAINYQVVSVSSDTIKEGQSINLNFSVLNIGDSPADTFSVKVELINSDNSKELISQSNVNQLKPYERKNFTITYPSGINGGSKSFLITIDPRNKIPELYKDNNVFNVPFYVKSDTSHPTLNVTFDGINIMDGDYVSSNPKIKIELSDNSLFPITDTSAVTIYLNGNPVYYALNQSAISYSFNATNPKYVVNYAPALKDGEYNIRILGKNSVGTFVDSSGYKKSFTVLGEPKLLNVYNYPNPFSKDTYFTFKLTQVPDELKIRIFTVAGRLVKEIDKYTPDLNYDFNKIYWDGRDQDGDMLANGVYFYKITLVKGDKKDNVIQKMAIVR